MYIFYPAYHATWLRHKIIENYRGLQYGSICGTIILYMSKIEKILQKMRHNPRDWRIEDIKTIAKRYEIDYRQPGSSHVTFRFSNGDKLTIPAHKPI